MKNFFLRNWPSKTQLFIYSFLNTTLLHASTGGSSLPFSSKLTIIKDAISGPFLLSAAVIMIVVTCLALAFGEWTDGFKKLINFVFWLSIAFAASSFITNLFGTGAVI